MITPLLILQPSPQHGIAVENITIKQFMIWYNKQFRNFREVLILQFIKSQQ